jgi:hypothetical protein
VPRGPCAAVVKTLADRAGTSRGRIGRDTGLDPGQSQTRRVVLICCPARLSGGKPPRRSKWQRRPSAFCSRPFGNDLPVALTRRLPRRWMPGGGASPRLEPWTLKQRFLYCFRIPDPRAVTLTVDHTGTCPDLGGDVTITASAAVPPDSRVPSPPPPGSFPTPGPAQARAMASPGQRAADTRIGRCARRRWWSARSPRPSERRRGTVW